jgi:DNA-binding MarR family transcriptional regulator
MENLNENFFLTLSLTCSETRQAFDAYTGISQPRRQLLAILARQGELSHAALQQELSLDGATVTRLVKEFEASGWVSRRLDPKNNRFTLVALTEAGRAEVAGLRASHHSFQAELLANISPAEQEAVIKILERLRANLRALEETRTASPKP